MKAGGNPAPKSFPAQKNGPLLRLKTITECQSHYHGLSFSSVQNGTVSNHSRAHLNNTHSQYNPSVHSMHENSVHISLLETRIDPYGKWLKGASAVTLYI